MSKYSPIVGAGEVIPIRDLIVSLLQAGVRRSPLTTTLAAVKEGIVGTLQDQGVQLENQYIDIICACVFSRREELRKVLTQMILE